MWGPAVIDDSAARMQRALLRASHLATFEQVPALVAEHAEAAGLYHARIFLADLQEDVLREVTGQGIDAGQGGQKLPVEASVPGTAFTHTRVMTTAVEGWVRHWVPVLNGTERLGVLRVDTEHDVTRTPDLLALMEDLASLAGLLVVTKRANSDSFARLIRSRPMTVSAEMQWTLMPPRTFANDRVTVAAVMEPAYATAGDAYDYAVAGDIAHLAVFDAMGHDTAAGLTATLAMATCRNHRRQGAGLPEICEAIERTLLEQFTHTRYTTAVLADLDLATGILSWVNCGHHPPVLIRGGHRITDLGCPPTHPLGTDLGLPVTVCREQLEPGDRLLLFTDGITEARDANDREFGRDRFVDFIVRHQGDRLPVPETLRRLIHAVLDHHDGRLNDDATVLLCEWHGDIDRREDLPRTTSDTMFPST